MNVSKRYELFKCIKCIVETLGFRQSNGHFVFLGETVENKFLDRENLKFAVRDLVAACESLR